MPRVTASSSRTTSTARRCRCSASPTATTVVPAASRRRTSSGSATATAGRTPAAWGRTRRCRWAPPGLSEEVVEHGRAADHRRDGPARCTVLRAALRRAGPDLAGAPRSWSSTSGSATRRPRSVLALLETPLAGLLHATATGHAGRAPAAALARRVRRRRWSSHAAGYPTAPRTGDLIEGLEELSGAVASACRHVVRRHRTAGHQWRSGVGGDGGGEMTCATARESAYARSRRSRIDGAHYRSDIAATRRR